MADSGDAGGKLGSYVRSMSNDTETFDIPIEVAEAYEQHFVPAIFAEWAPIILEAAGVAASAPPGTRLLDVGCGTGIVARTARRIAGPDLEITGVDLNPSMLAVAERTAEAEGLVPPIDWRPGDAGALPFDDETFDVAVSQMAARFFPDLSRALAEMARVVRPGGTLAWVVPAALSEQPAYGPFVDAAAAHVDVDARHLLEGVYWNRGDRQAFAADVEGVGLEVTTVRARAGTARFASPADFVEIEIGATPLAGRIDPATQAAIADEVARRLADYARPGEPFDIPLVCNVIAARRPV